jgi:hypothetical protein
MKVVNLDYTPYNRRIGMPRVTLDHMKWMQFEEKDMRR